MISLGISLVIRWLSTSGAHSFPGWRSNIPLASECGQKNRVLLILGV